MAKKIQRMPLNHCADVLSDGTGRVAQQQNEGIEKVTIEEFFEMEKILNGVEIIVSHT